MNAEPMDPALAFVLALVVIVVAAKGMGYVSTLLRQPPVAGMLVAGLLLGPTVLDMLRWPFFVGCGLSESLGFLSHLGVLFLMFIAGMEMEIEVVRSTGRPALLAGLLGVVAPLGLGVLVAVPFDYGLEGGVFIGLVLAATSVSISAQTLIELGVIRTRVATALLSAAVVDDVLVILLFSLFSALGREGGGGEAILWSLLRMFGFVVVGTWLGLRLLPALSGLMSRLPISEGVVTLSIVVTLLYAWSAEMVGGVTAITGAFLAGLVFSRTPVRTTVETGLRGLTYAWLVPVFFVGIGLQIDARTLGLGGVPFVLVIIAVAVVSKVAGCGLGARLGGFSWGEALRVGVGMTSRGEVGLIVAAAGLAAGLIGEVAFASVVLMVLATSLLTPVMLRVLYPAPSRSGEAEVPAA